MNLTHQFKCNVYHADLKMVCKIRLFFKKMCLCLLKNILGLEEVTAVKSTCSSFRETRFSSRMITYNSLPLQFQGIQYPLLAFVGARYRYTCRQDIQTHTIKIKLSFRNKINKQKEERCYS